MKAGAVTRHRAARARGRGGAAPAPERRLVGHRRDGDARHDRVVRRREGARPGSSACAGRPARGSSPACRSCWRCGETDAASAWRWRRCSCRPTRSPGAGPSARRPVASPPSPRSFPARARSCPAARCSCAGARPQVRGASYVIRLDGAVRRLAFANREPYQREAVVPPAGPGVGLLEAAARPAGGQGRGDRLRPRRRPSRVRRARGGGQELRQRELAARHRRPRHVRRRA